MTQKFNKFLTIVSFFLASVCQAEIEFISSDTTAQVVTIAGTDRNSGSQTTLSTGVISNETGAFVKQNDQGDGSGTASATIRVDPTEEPSNMFAFMQVAASALPEFDFGTFAEAKVTYFFSNPIEIEVESGIKQGDTRFFIDTVERQLTGSITRFDLPQGLHSFEIEVVPGVTVVNPNFSVGIFATDSGSGGGDVNNDDFDSLLAELLQRLENLLITAKTIKPRLTNANREAQRIILADVSSQIKSIKVFIKDNLESFPTNKQKAIKAGRRSLSTALRNFKNAVGVDARKLAKQALVKAIKQFKNKIEA